MIHSWRSGENFMVFAWLMNILDFDLPFERMYSSTWPIFYFTNRFVLVFLFPIHTSVCILFEGSICLLQTFLESTFAIQTVCSSCVGIFYSNRLVYFCTSEDFLFTPASAILLVRGSTFFKSIFWIRTVSSSFLFLIHTSLCNFFGQRFNIFLEYFCNPDCIQLFLIFYSHQLVYLCTSEDILFTPACAVFLVGGSNYFRVFL